MKSDFAVSELIGAILLVSLVTLAASIIAVTVLSQPPPEDIPQITAIAENQSQTVYLLHTGGDSLKENEIKTYINGQDSPFSIANNENWPWTAGKTLKVDYPGSEMPEYIQLVHTGGSSQTLILTAYFVPSVVTGAPTGLPTTSPTTIPTTIPTTMPTTTVTTTVTTTTTTSPTPTPTPGCGSISGAVCHDMNNNNQCDSGEGLPGWTINVWKRVGPNWIWEAYATSNSDGSYSITGLDYQPTERYAVDVITQWGWQQTFPTTPEFYDIQLKPSSQNDKCYATGLDFGNRHSWYYP